MPKVHSEMTRKEKRLARIMTLQVIYAWEMAQSDSENVIDMIDEDLELKISNETKEYIHSLVDLIKQHTNEMDRVLSSKSKNWELNRITLMDRLILKMALTEMIYMEDIPPKVSISEGVEIAKEFSTDDSSSFVNGIMDSVYNDLIKGKYEIEN